MAMRLSQKSHDMLLALVLRIQDRHKQNNEFRDKLTALDTEYAIQKTITTDPCDENITIEGIKVPLVGAESDTITAQLAKLFVARQPIFPVLATKDNWDEAMALQALIDRDARLLGWGRQMLLFLNRSVRYNIGALEIEPTAVSAPIIKESDKPSVTNLKVNYEIYTHTRLNAIDMYNVIYDPRVAPADIQSKGEYAGYNELITRSALKILGTNLAKQELAYNLDKAYKSSLLGIDDFYFYPPDVSDYIAARQIKSEINWIDWAGLTDNKPAVKDDMHLKTKLYVRIIPDEFGLGNYKGPKIYKITCINNQYIISLQEVVTPFDLLPILFSDLREDGLGWQTKSPGEQLIPYQDSATDLLNIRLEGSKRAISDRALYDSNYIDSNQVNSIISTAKIPLKQSLKNLGERPKMSEVYWPIPFEGQGVINAITDLNTLLAIKDQVNGQNFISRGERQKGNRTAAEYTGLAAATEDKSLPYAIRLEEQVWTPAKQIIKTFILLQQATGSADNAIIDPYTEQNRDINLSAIRGKMIDFKITDGLYPKQMISNPDVLIALLQNLAQFPDFTIKYDTGKFIADVFHLLNIDTTKYRRDPNEIRNILNQQFAARSNPATTGGDTGSSQATPNSSSQQPT